MGAGKFTSLSLKLVAMVTLPCPLCTGESQMNSLISQTLSQNQTLHGNVIQLKLWPFCDIFANFGQNLVATATSLRPLAIRNVFFGLADHENLLL